MRNIFALILFLLVLSAPVQAELKEGDSLPNPTITAEDGSKVPLHDLLNKVSVIHMWKANWPQCNAEIPHLEKLVPEYKDKPVSFISINLKNPEGQVKAELKKFKKKYNMTIPAYSGKGQGMDKDFKVLKLPRLILVRADQTVYQDFLFLKAEDLKVEIDNLLAELPAEEATSETSDK
jgi:peroxiredoxin